MSHCTNEPCLFNTDCEEFLVVEAAGSLNGRRGGQAVHAREQHGVSLLQAAHAATRHRTSGGGGRHDRGVPLHGQL